MTVGLSFPSQTTLQLNVHQPDFHIFSGKKPPNPRLKMTPTSECFQWLVTLLVTSTDPPGAKPRVWALTTKTLIQSIIDEYSFIVMCVASTR